ncbi:hypothetical protein IT568_01975, partial [bacterium]|nr:hypothetical protein [bacterium]
MKRPKLIPLFFVTAMVFLTNIVFASTVNTRFNIYVPPNNNVSSRKVFLSMTAVQGSVGDTTVVNVTDDAADGDTDESQTVYLTKGETFIIFTSENGVNDDKGGPSANLGDYYTITSNRPISVMSGTLSDWEFDFVPGYAKNDGSMDFYFWVPGGGDITYFGIDVFGYHDGTTVTVNDITSTAKTTSGKTTVSLPGTLKTTL